ncbi:OLC1v1014469C4 [Oldenlandia corymbosa var. corymbosa]|uniref:OLC1v1014469C4 n=1 Tax=Oldenlandia corymbosa var. corymbosa TaxID=529605 RepID=A0AAV1E0U2_OLDCO|nr:OLC1v1014469C4 [Oldenlandia corymbosa var. corymbosa]
MPSDYSHQGPKRHSLNATVKPPKKPRLGTVCSASICIKPLGLPLISKTTQLPCKSLHLEPNKHYTVGRSHSSCDFLFVDKRVSKTHFQIVFDSFSKKVCLCDGGFLGFLHFECSARVKASLNGVFVNGVRIGAREIVGLCVGDEVLLACGDESFCNVHNHVGFVVERIVFLEEIVDRNIPKLRASGLSLDHGSLPFEKQQFDAKVGFLLSMCRDILCSGDPISLIKKYTVFGDAEDGKCIRKWEKGLFRFLRRNLVGTNEEKRLNSRGASCCDDLVRRRDLAIDCHKEVLVVPETIAKSKVDGIAEEPVETSCLLRANAEELAVNSCVRRANPEEPVQNSRVQHANGVNANAELKVLSSESSRKDDTALCENGCKDDNKGAYIPPPGRKFYLNRLQHMGYCSSETHDIVSLPDVFYPVESLQRVFIATFTSDIPWFLSYCGIPHHLPITIACHNAERCWSASPDNRTLSPYSDFPQLVLVYPPFPEVIAFGKDRKKSGIACHHPKLFVLQREDCVRVVITSANLVARQWHNVTNTVWWQDFPRSTAPEYLSLFIQSSYGPNNRELKSDFGAQLVGFIASLVIDIPSQAYWIPELAKYNYEGALVHLVASVPGIYSPRSPYISHSEHYLSGNEKMPKSSCANSLGSVETSVVGLSHLFRTSADSNGLRLKKLAAFLRNCRENVYGMSEILLRREINISADVNAVSVLVPNPEEFSLEDCIQIGFLPRDIAKWVAPLSDDGFFAFSGYICPKDVLSAALEGSTSKVELILYVSQGPCFSSFSESMTSQHGTALCSLIASIQRCVGLWRLHEVLGTYKWPEHLETDFCFGSSSVGSVNAKFLAAFSAAAGKRAVEESESEESDPHWGCWSASQELKRPSIKIIFPTIERVKSASSGILASKYLLCFSQKTWQRLENVGILHDAVPCPVERAGHPMHVKVARRRFQSKRNGTSFGWVYCGSHNFSAAAWGSPLPQKVDGKKTTTNMSSSILGSRLHICNYELGIIFTVPPSDSKGRGHETGRSLDDIVLPFVTPARKYRPRDEPATARAMREALAAFTELDREIDEFVEMNGECPDEEEEVLETGDDFVAEEREEERAYADKLWSQVSS